MSAIAMAKNLMFSIQDRNIENLHHYIRDWWPKEEIKLEYVGTKDQAVIFSRSISHYKLIRYVETLILT